MLIALLFVAALALAFANGANDNFKATNRWVAWVVRFFI